MSNVVSIDPESRFVGNWKCCDGFSDITFSVAASEGSFIVSVTDPDNPLNPEVFGTVYKPASRTLEFLESRPASLRQNASKFVNWGTYERVIFCNGCWNSRLLRSYTIPSANIQDMQSSLCSEAGIG